MCVARAPPDPGRESVIAAECRSGTDDELGRLGFH